jgi:hypothetical protein
MSFAGQLTLEGYSYPRQLADGRWLALRQMMHTWGLFLIDDGDTVGYRCRWCYEHFVPASIALHLWDGVGDAPPGAWVKQKGRDSHGQPVDRLNPAFAL